MPVEELEPLVGEWVLEGANRLDPSDPLRGSVSFEWMEGGRWLVQRWSTEVEIFPDGIALFGPDASGEGLVQHYFDSRGVARVYGTSLEDGVWKLWREEGDDDFWQRFSGALSDDGATISGAWEIAEDKSTWRHDFDLTYRRLG